MGGWREGLSIFLSAFLPGWLAIHNVMHFASSRCLHELNKSGSVARFWRGSLPPSLPNSRGTSWRGLPSVNTFTNILSRGRFSCLAAFQHMRLITEKELAMLMHERPKTQLFECEVNVVTSTKPLPRSHRPPSLPFLPRSTPKIRRGTDADGLPLVS